MIGFEYKAGIQFNKSGERWPERRSDYFVVNYINA